MTEDLSILVAALIFPGGLFALSLGLLMAGIDRKLIARLQRRVGPPLMQPFFDLIKLMRKQTLVPENTSIAVFIGLPVAGFTAMAFAPSLIPFPGNPGLFPDAGGVIVVLYLLAVPGIAIMLAGSASGSVYGSLGFSREMTLVLAYEGPLMMVLLSVAIYTGHMQGGTVSLSLLEMASWQREHGANLFQPVLWPALCAYLISLPATLGIGPFDIAEAETEILEGPLLEYSGPPLGFFNMMQALQRVTVLALGVALFWPGSIGGLTGLVLFVLKILVLAVFGVTFLRASIARMRIDQALSYFLTWPVLCGLIGILLVQFTG